MRGHILRWLQQIGIAGELEQSEIDLISAQLGALDRKKAINATWQAEGMVVLAWALGWAELPACEVQCEPSDIANGLGFLASRAETPLQEPRLRDTEEIEKWADTYLTLHWRLRLLDSDPGHLDFVSSVERCTWGPLRLDMLNLIDNDILIHGVRIDQLDERKHRGTISIVQERHQAFNWLLGFESLYSRVTTELLAKSPGPGERVGIRGILML